MTWSNNSYECAHCRLIFGQSHRASYDFFDTATLYGGCKSEERLGAVLSKHRSRFTLASKCGMAIIPADGAMKRAIDGRPESIRRDCDNRLRRLQTEYSLWTRDAVIGDLAACAASVG